MSYPKFCEVSPTECTCKKIEPCPNKDKDAKYKKNKK